MSRYYQKREFKKSRPWGVVEPDCPATIILEVVREENDDNDRLIRRYMKKFKKSKLMDEIREHDSYTKPSMEKKLARERRRKVHQRLRAETDFSQED